VLGAEVHADNGSAIGSGQPCDERVAQGTGGSEDGEKAQAGDSQSACCKQERRQGDGGWKDSWEEHREHWVPLHPMGDAGAAALANPTAQGCFTAFFAEMPSGVSADETSEDGAGCEQERVTAIDDKEKQKQVSGAGNGQRKHRRIDDGYEEQSNRTQMPNPMGDKRMMGLGSRGRKDAHGRFDVRIGR